MFNRIERLPFEIAVLGYLAFMGYQYYMFAYYPTGELAAQKEKIAQMQKKLNEYKKNLDEKSASQQTAQSKNEQLTRLQAEIGQITSQWTRVSQLPQLMKGITDTARSSGILIDRIEPSKKTSQPLYQEQELKLSARGNFSQFVLFLQKLSGLKSPLQIVETHLKPKIASTAQGVPLDVRLTLKAFLKNENEP